YQGLLSTRLIIPYIGMGETVHFLFTWGPTPTENSIFLNGKRLNAEIKGVSTIPNMVGRSAFLVFGSTLSGPDQAWNMMTSIIRDVKVYNDVVDPRRPTIEAVGHNAFDVVGYSGKLVSGDALKFWLRAEPGGVASFDIGGSLTGIPMVEDADAPGSYTGTFTVPPGLFLQETQVVGRFSNRFGYAAEPLPSARKVTIDSRTLITVQPSNDLIPADRSSRAGLTVKAINANGKAVPNHGLKLTLSTTDEYTGTVGGGSFEDQVGGTIDVDWGGVTDSFGEVTAQYISGFAAKTILVSAKDMVSGDVGVGWVRSFINGTVDIVVTEPKVSALSVTGSMDVSLSRDWLTADGRSRSRITAVVKDASGKPLSGHHVRFTLLGDNGSIREVQGKTDSRGRAYADYIAGTLMGQVQVEVRDLTSGMVAIVPIELRPDAPAVIELAADPGEVVTGGQSTVMAKVTDTNKNPNRNVDVLYDISVGEGTVSSPSVATDEKGNASVTFTAGDKPGLVTVRGTVISREPTAEELSAAEGAIFLYGLEDDPGRLEVIEWLVKAGDEVVEGQDLVVLEDRSDNSYTVVAPRDGTVSTFVAEERDRVEYGDTLGYIIEQPE
ncbi:MAG: Ig-like domain-containing protein, partial [bacterium]|nr:Ig-like domain-containing protein [bacterium]